MARLAENEETEDFTNITHGILLSDQELKRRYVIRHLLIMPGLSIDRYREAFGSFVMDDFPILKDWMDRGFAQICKQDETSVKYLALTQTGLGLSDYLGPQLISHQVRAAMEAWEEEQAHAHDVISRQSEKL